MKNGNDLTHKSFNLIKRLFILIITNRKLYMTDKVKYWVELSDYDLDTAEAMLASERFLYVGFMCHQATEKIFKAYYAGHHNSTPPYSHSLSYLAEKCGLLEELTEQQIGFINMIEPHEY
jgi:HEPN domain-containing protein